MPQDSQLQQAVLAGFAWKPGVAVSHIGVTSCEGAVTLTGHLESFARKRAAKRVKAVVRWQIRVVAAAARAAPGAAPVLNDIVLNDIAVV